MTIGRFLAVFSALLINMLEKTAKWKDEKKMENV